MNPVEIEEAVSQLALKPLDREQFPFSFLRAFGNPETTIRRLRTGSTNQSDVGGVLQRSNIHIATCGAGEVGPTLDRLRDSPKTATAKAKFILATDGDSFQAEDRTSGETVACDYLFRDADGRRSRIGSTQARKRAAYLFREAPMVTGIGSVTIRHGDDAAVDHRSYDTAQ